MGLAKKKKFKTGKIKRHKFRRTLGLKSGFGKPWSANSVLFRVEFCWENEDGSEENEQVHWVECRKFAGEEKSFLRAHYAQSKEEWSDRETLESKFVAVYCAGFLVEQKDELHLNQCFVFPSTKEGNETIRQPIYQLKWSQKLADNSVFSKNLAVVMNNSIWHKW